MGRGKSREPGLILEEHSENGNSISGMPRQCPTQRDQRPARPAWPRLARRCVLACAFAALAAAGPALAGGGTAAAISRAPTGVTAGTVISKTAAAPAQQVTVGITSVNPQIARPGRAVTVQGTVSNTTRRTVSGLTVQIWSSSFRLTSRAELSQYAAGNLPNVNLPVVNALARLPGTLAPGAVRDWSVRIPASSLAMTTFGVYPLAAQVNSGAAVLSTDHTFLPFWPGSAAAAGMHQRMKIAWVWPIFSAPEQAACPALLSNDLASSVAGGRLSRLLAAGSTRQAVRADLTWAIDPSVLAAAAVMRTSYRVGGSATCSGAVTKPASPAARTWLTRLRSVTAQQDYFVTPFADVDMSALTHAAMNTDLKRAQAKGYSLARQYLGGTQRPATPESGAIAWPAGGVADYGVLGNLGADGWRSVILDSSLMPPRTPTLFTPSAITSALDGVDGRLNVALSDSTLSQVLAGGPTAAQARAGAAQAGGSRSAATAQAAAAAGSFATEQLFLAETAMIVAEQPATPRSVVITPPRQWNPAAGLATALLAESDDAPWLRPDSLAGLMSAKSSAGQVPRKPPPAEKFAPGELHRSLLRRVKGLEGDIRLQASMFRQSASTYLAGAVAAVESSAWRGNPARARALLALGVRVPGRAGTAGPHHRHRAGHPDREVRLRPGVDQQPAEPDRHGAAAGPGALRPDDGPPSRHQRHHREAPAADRGDQGALCGGGLHGAEAEPGRAERDAPARDQSPAHRGRHSLRYHGHGHRGHRHRGVRGDRDRPCHPPWRGQRRVPVSSPQSRPRSGRERCGTRRTA